ncbi:hypothetical protein PGT21_008900 [Puccinia graminis f. sp. tritici]|uniref:Uncharacterized protein n=1 Tax=Puccinia graminis f. sp. tritici TaxID=56615 RepID=A0A5B0N242_PUCGR|nr:hypothetical protein PGT21_008900 [Puccinia graminis f. sp. tritici]
MFRRRLCFARVVLALENNSTQHNSTQLNSGFNWKTNYTLYQNQDHHHRFNRQTGLPPLSQELSKLRLTTTPILKTPGSDQFQSPASSSQTRNVKFKISGLHTFATLHRQYPATKSEPASSLTFFHNHVRQVGWMSLKSCRRRRSMNVGVTEMSPRDQTILHISLHSDLKALANDDPPLKLKGPLERK